MATHSLISPPLQLTTFPVSYPLFQKPADLQGKKIAMIGLGKSGVAMARFCNHHGAEIHIFDDKPLSELEEIQTSFQGFFDKLSVYSLSGSVAEQALFHVDLIVLSPGVPPFLPILNAAQKKGIPMTGELELASRFIKAPIVGITGTNGKSTVTSLCGAIAEQTRRPSFCGGNLGIPLIQAVETNAAESTGIVVCEMSSFQLETVETLRCRAAAILNVTPDHLDRYASFQNYGEAKAKIVQNQQPDDILILNADDPNLLDLQKQFFPDRSALYFSTTKNPATLPDQPGTNSLIPLAGYLEKDQMILRLPPQSTEPSVPHVEAYPISELQIIGQHNLANALAAFLLMRASGLATYEQVRAAAKQFQPLPHRMQKVAHWNGITYYDDSKGTNVEAVAASLSGFPKPFVLIAGGKHKGGSYDPLHRVLSQNQVRGVVLIGEAAPLIQSVIPAHISCFFSKTMEEAVKYATLLCQEGDAVILSPACSSFDMFRNYVHRAEVFRDSVFSLIQQDQKRGKNPNHLMPEGKK